MTSHLTEDDRSSISGRSEENTRNGVFLVLVGRLLELRTSIELTQVPFGWCGDVPHDDASGVHWHHKVSGVLQRHGLISEDVKDLKKKEKKKKKQKNKWGFSLHGYAFLVSKFQNQAGIMNVSMYNSYKKHYEMRCDQTAEVMIWYISVIKLLKVVLIKSLCRQNHFYSNTSTEVLERCRWLKVKNYLSSLKTIYDCELIFIIYNKYIIIFLMFVWKYFF